MFALFIVLLLGMVASFFFQIPALSVAISALFVVFSTMTILYETSNIIHGGETNYILRNREHLCFNLQFILEFIKITFYLFK